ncbi:MAG: Stage II sporulation protein P [Thermoanaerobacterales bacterium 50_218]|nr:MAG: Stage II sporulation protein P [Thermoanaerobacterales bacterium 50_218]HAA89489.1 stage II sporulation protein P [Peptococcaceae bacterium]
MNRVSLRFFAFIIVLLLAPLLGQSPCLGWEGLTGRFEEERTDGGFYTILDDRGNVIHRTAHKLYVGDEYFTSKNLHYRITRIEGDCAYAEEVTNEKESPQKSASTLEALLAKAADSGARKNLVAIYHTHSDESYVPSDGSASVYANGGIFKVGKVFAEKLRSEGFEVLHSLRPHDPHDANAYYRSRRTAVQLLQKQPVAIIDVHRDAVPPDVYEAVVNGQKVTKIKFVIGRENPRMSANLQFAKELKSVLDEIHPGLVEGILVSRGNYNQDLAPRALLVEVGSHTNAREDAQKGVALFADAFPEVFGITGVRPEAPAPPTNRGDWKALFWGILIAGGMIAGFLYLNTGSWKGAWERFLDFFRIEFGGKKEGER